MMVAWPGAGGKAVLALLSQSELGLAGPDWL